MFDRRQVTQNEIVARQMRRFMRTLHVEQRLDPQTVATRYGEFLWYRHNRLALDKKSTRSRFYIALSIDGSNGSLSDITKRAVLISDTLLLTHNWSGSYGDIAQTLSSPNYPQIPSGIAGKDALIAAGRQVTAWDREHLTENFGMYCPSLDELGQWILDARPLLEAGLVWYLPSYAIATYRTTGGVDTPINRVTQRAVIDYLIQDGRVVDASGADPMKSRLVRPIIRIDLPFIEGVGLREFSKITTDRFVAYSAFRDFLRQSFLDMDTAMNDVQSDRELVKLGLQINDQVRAVRAQMETVCRKRAVGATGAMVGSVSAALVAVYGPALAEAVSIVGVGGGIWGIVYAAAENSPKALREDKWYYVWTLARKSNVPGF